MIKLRVKEIALEKGFNMSSLSRASDLSFNTIKRLFREPYHEATTTTLGKVAEALGVHPGELIEVVDDPAHY